MEEPSCATCASAAVFHDIGKIAVPEAILDKRGPLTAEERAEIERHTVVGEQILSPVEFLADVRRWSATSTSAGTAAATRTAWPARRSRSARGSSWPATPTTP